MQRIGYHFYIFIVIFVLRVYGTEIKRRNYPLVFEKPFINLHKSSHTLKFQDVRSKLGNLQNERSNIRTALLSSVLPFEVWTLSKGVVQYPSKLLPLGTPIGLHAYTNESGFLECMWGSATSLVDFITSSPVDVKYMFLTYDSPAVQVVAFMRLKLMDALQHSGLSLNEQVKFLDNCFFVITPVHELGNWLPTTFSQLACTGDGCGLAQIRFYSRSWPIPVKTVKRVDGHYDWDYQGEWGPSYSRIELVQNACDPSSVAGKNNTLVVVDDRESHDCTIAKKVIMAQVAGASGVIVFSRPGMPPYDINCYGEDCGFQVTIPVASISFDRQLLRTLMARAEVVAEFQTTPSPNFHFAIDSYGEIVEPGWFLYPSMEFLAWQMQWLVFERQLLARIESLGDRVVPVFNRTVMVGKNGTGYALIELGDLSQYDQAFLEARLGCEGTSDADCPPWDHTVSAHVCCDNSSALCGTEIGRWITPFRRRIGHWLTDVSPLLPLLTANSTCAFVMQNHAWWAKPWLPSLNLRFVKSTADAQRPFQALPLFRGGKFDRNYNKKYVPLEFRVPEGAAAVKIYAVISGHGADENNCCEFCVTAHHFVVNARYRHVNTFDAAGSPMGCARRVLDGAVPNEHGTWLYGRGGWCDGMQVEPWVFDVTGEVDFTAVNNVTYRGLFNGEDPDPKANPGLIEMTSFIVFYK